MEFRVPLRLRNFAGFMPWKVNYVHASLLSSDHGQPLSTKTAACHSSWDIHTGLCSAIVTKRLKKARCSQAALTPLPEGGEASIAPNLDCPIMHCCRWLVALHFLFLVGSVAIHINHCSLLLPPSSSSSASSCFFMLLQCKLHGLTLARFPSGQECMSHACI